MQRRNFPRAVVQWPVEFSAPSQQKTAIGDIFDVSPKGVFVRPYDLYGPGILAGDLVRLTISQNDVKRQVLGTVRWVGFSATHHCRGFGVEFAQVQAELVPS